MIGAYQPRTRRARMADRIEDLRRKAMHALNVLLVRGAGAMLLFLSILGFVALASYSPGDSSLNNAASAVAANYAWSLG